MVSTAVLSPSLMVVWLTEVLLSSLMAATRTGEQIARWWEATTAGMDGLGSVRHFYGGGDHDGGGGDDGGTGREKV